MGSPVTKHGDFVLEILNYKNGGTYLEVGSGHFKDENNTYLLEKEYGWTGVGIELDSDLSKLYIDNRTNKCINDNALTVDYKKVLKNNFDSNRIDYLQIDVDNNPKYSNLLALINVPLSEYRFNVITFEHDLVRSYKFKEMREAQRVILDALGYVLVVPGNSEDWWVDGTNIDSEKYQWAFSAFQKEMVF